MKGKGTLIKGAVTRDAMKTEKIFLITFLYMTCSTVAQAGPGMSPTQSVRGNEEKQFEYDIQASADQTYDDNITFAESNEQTDFISRLTVGGGVKYEGRKTRVQFKGDVSQEIFWKESGNNNTSEEVKVSFVHHLTRFDTVQITDGFSHTYEPRSFEEEFERTGGRFSYFRNNLNLLYGHEFSERFQMRAGYGNDISVASRSDVLDSFVNSASLEASYAFSSRSSVMGRYDFLHRHLDPGGNAVINTFSAGATQYFTEQLSVEGQAGLDVIHSFNGDSIVRPLWFVRVADQFTERNTADIQFSQRYSTNSYTSDVFNSWRISGNLRSQLLKKLRGSASVFYGRGKYDVIAVKDSFFGGSAVLTCDLAKRVEGTLSYSYSRQSSNFDVREYGKNLISLGIQSVF